MATNISAEDEHILDDAVSSGKFKNKEEALSEALRLLSETTTDQNGAYLAAEAWRKRFHQHLEATPPSSATTVDVSRESIYEGQGE
jgi:Arc/MetJ-type ribon-helix-helix transcriptional regulator